MKQIKLIALDLANNLSWALTIMHIFDCILNIFDYIKNFDMDIFEYNSFVYGYLNNVFLNWFNFSYHLTLVKIVFFIIKNGYL